MNITDAMIHQYRNDPEIYFFSKGRKEVIMTLDNAQKGQKKIKLSAKETEEIPRIKLCVYLTSHNNIQIKVNK